jgi:hypothetical protein
MRSRVIGLLLFGRKAQGCRCGGEVREWWRRRALRRQDGREIRALLGSRYLRRVVRV